MTSSLAPLKFEWNPVLEESLKSHLLQIWVDTVNAGGALGYLPPVTEATVEALADHAFARVDRGIDEILLAYHGRDLVGWVLLERDARSFANHWRVVKRLQVHPQYQRLGYGSAILSEVERRARDDLGLSFLLLTARSGTGADRLYRQLGYEEVGRIPAALRLAADDFRDEIYMCRHLDRPVQRPH